MLLPCNDTCNSHQNNTPTSIQQAQDHHQEDNDICSPFCFCSCCATAMTTLYIPTFNVALQSSKQEFTTFYPQFFTEEYSFIWQPPKLS